MRRKIPNIAALIAFEAAARHESCSRAAEELCLTESAVSRQLTTLEHFLGVKLFNRVRKRITLSDAGRRYRDQVRASLDQLEWNTLSLMAHQGMGGSLELAVIPTFTSKWLIPRLKGFYDLHPEIWINMKEKPGPFLFRNSLFDAAVNFDHPAWAGVIKIELFSEELIPVLSPRHYHLADLRDPVDLADIPLLHKVSSGPAGTWKRWFDQMGCKGVNAHRGSYYELNSMLIDAAVAGLGAALVPRFYVAEELRCGTLAAPFEHGLRDEKRFCVVYPEDKQGSPVLRTFVDWLVDTAREFRAGRNGG